MKLFEIAKVLAIPSQKTIVKVGDIIVNDEGTEYTVYDVKPKKSPDDPYGPYVSVRNGRVESHYRLGLKLSSSGKVLSLMKQQGEQKIWQFQKVKSLSTKEKQQMAKMTGGLVSFD